MKTPELKARIASLLDIPVTDVVLNKEEGAVPSFEMHKGKLVITYEDVNSLSHEFLHACFTPRGIMTDLIYNALEDHRVSVLADAYDKPIANANKNVMSDKEYEKIIREVTHENGAIQDSLKVLSAIALPDQSKVDWEKVLDEELTATAYPKDSYINLVRETRANARKNPGFRQVIESHQDLKSYLTLPQEMRNGQTNHIEDMPEDITEEDVEKGLDKSMVKQETMHKMESAQILRMNKTDEFVLKSGIRKIIRNRSIGKTYNTTEGKLASKRLGRYPGQYVFRKKTRPSPETKLYLLIDLSGSMLDYEKLETVSEFTNTIRDLDIKNFTVELRGFNMSYFKNGQIQRDLSELKANCIYSQGNQGRQNGQYNDDAHWLNEIVKEIQADPTENKCLLILSDGEFAPSREYDETTDEDMHDAVKNLEDARIPYMSIGIMDDTVEEFYPKAKVAQSISEVVSLLSKHAKELVKF